MGEKAIEGAYYNFSVPYEQKLCVLPFKIRDIWGRNKSPVQFYEYSLVQNRAVIRPCALDAATLYQVCTCVNAK